MTVQSNTTGVFYIKSVFGTLLKHWLSNLSNTLFVSFQYAVDVPENVKEKLILRIPIEDKDLINTPNWISKFVIAKGNENGNFRIDTDPETNEGLLYVSKVSEISYYKM